MASRMSFTAESGVPSYDKANKHRTSRQEPAIDGSNSTLGLDGASDFYDRKYRTQSRSPSPYHRKPTRSPSPYRRDRSPSPYRHNRGNRGGDHDSRSSYNKRKASPPPRPGRPDKRFHAEINRHLDRQPNDQYGNTRSRKDRADTSDRRVSPISYAELEHPILVPGFRVAHNSRSNGRYHDDSIGSRSHAVGSAKQGTVVKQSTTTTALSSQRKDVEMTNADDEPEYTLAIEDQASTVESREEKKRRWAAKRAEMAAQQAAGTANTAPLLQQAILNNASESTTPNVATPAATNDSPPDSPRFSEMGSAPASPDVMLVDKREGASESNSPSAANYDPTEDMLADRARAASKAQQSELSTAAYNEADPSLQPAIPVVKKPASTKSKKKDFDMFDFNDDEEDEEEEEEEEANTAKGTVLDAKLLDNWDDPDGYYKIISNELVDTGRYRMVKTLGRGVFANVAQAEDVQDPAKKLVAIKIVRRNDLMRKASQKEIDFLRKANEADPKDTEHIIRLLGNFDHKGHLCIVFEHMAKNLRDLLKEDTQSHGLSFPAVKLYTRQMFRGLRHLQDHSIIHLDLKPDNILVSHDRKSVKLCDFGTAVDARDPIERTGYLVSRFYRAPEIVLDMEIGHGIDMWAIGCTIYELWTGKILFTGRTNNQMVKAFLECLGWPSEKLLRKGTAEGVLTHFELGPPLIFFSRETDAQGNPSIRKIEQQKKISRDLKTRIHDGAQGITKGGPTAAELTDFADLLGQTLNWNVEKRIQPREALKHKFLETTTSNNTTKKLMPRSSVIKPSMVKRGGSSLRK